MLTSAPVRVELRIAPQSRPLLEQLRVQQHWQVTPPTPHLVQPHPVESPSLIWQFPSLIWHFYTPLSPSLLAVVPYTPFYAAVLAPILLPTHT